MQVVDDNGHLYEMDKCKDLHTKILLSDCVGLYNIVVSWVL